MCVCGEEDILSEGGLACLWHILFGAITTENFSSVVSLRARRVVRHVASSRFFIF